PSPPHPFFPYTTLFRSCPETAFVSDNQARYLKYPGKTSTRPNRGGVGTLEGNTNPENGGFQGTSKLLSPLEASQLLTDEYSAKIDRKSTRLNSSHGSIS